MSAPQPSLHTQELAELVARMRQGDASATGELIRRTALRLEHLARRMLRRFPAVRAQAETADVVQESSLRLLNALRAVTPDSMRHFNNLAGQHIRYHLLDLARRFRRGAPQPLDEHPEPAAPGTGEGEAEELERWAEFHEAVQRLPDDQLEVFNFRFYQGFTWPEIAGVLGADEKTGRRRWDRACLALRKALRGWAPPEDGPAE
jgi:RNA polymerase sigma-70 factor (ECF subfamily)